MLFARGHLNLYLSSRISLPPAPFVHLSSPSFPSSSLSPSLSPPRLVRRLRNIAKPREKSRGISKRERERVKWFSPLFLASILLIQSSRETFCPRGFCTHACGVISLKYLQIFQRLGGHALKRGFRRAMEGGAGFSVVFRLDSTVSSVFPPRGGGSFSDSLLARVLSRLAARLRLAFSVESHRK